MIVDSHQHVMLPASMQIKKMDDAGVDKAILFTTTPHVERAATANFGCNRRRNASAVPLRPAAILPKRRISKMKRPFWS